MNNFKFAFRGLLKNPGFTCIAVFTLALGIGLVTIQFSLVNGALYKGLPFERSERLMVVERLNARGRGISTPLPDFLVWRDQQKSFREFAAYRNELLEIGGENVEALTHRGAALSADVLRLLGVSPLLGRGLSEDDTRTDAPPVVLLGYHVWKNNFSGDPHIVGRAIRLRGETATVIGVMPEGFAYPVNESAWTNLRPTTTSGGRLATSLGVRVIGRLDEGSTLAAARTEFEILVQQTETAAAIRESEKARANIVPLLETLHPAELTILMYSLLGVVGGVLALACLNVANLLSARALQRGQELAIRSALGASRGRIVRQMLCESALLAGLGALGGLLLASWLVPLLDRELAVSSRPFWIVMELDYRVLGATALLTILVGLLAGLFPALRATRSGTSAMLKDAAGGASNVRLGRLNRGLVTAQVGMSCMILVATSVLVDGSRKVSKIDLPFNADNVLSAQLRFNAPELRDDTTRRAFQQTLLERLRALPGVQSASAVGNYPFSGSGTKPVEVRSVPLADGASPPPAYINPVSAGFFGSLHIPLRSGRDFTESDRLESERVAIVSESFARRFWPGQSALGQHVRLHSSDPAKAHPWLTVVGVAADLPIDSPERRHGIHVPLAQSSSSELVILLAASGDPRSLTRPLHDTVRALSMDVPVDRVFTLTERTADDLRLLVTFGQLSLAFGVSGLVLAAIGVYGVTSFAVQRRTREFGLRMALGATRGDVLRLVLNRGLRQCALGIAAGGLFGWMISKPLLGVTGTVMTPPGAAVYLIACGSVGAAVLIALWRPALHATRVHPMVALRNE